MLPERKLLIKENLFHFFVIIVFFILFLCPARPLGAQNNSSLHAVPFNVVRIKDTFWSPKLEIYRKNTIPHSWANVDRDIREIKAAAGVSNASGAGLWTEANLYKLIETIAYSLSQFPEPELDLKLNEIISYIAKAQKPDGFIHAYTLNKN